MQGRDGWSHRVKYLPLFAGLLTSVACHDEPLITRPSPIPVTLSEPKPFVCELFDADLLIDGHLAKPTAFTSKRRLEGYEIQGREAGTTERAQWDGWTFESRSTLDAGQYHVRVRVGGCWSRWQDFSLTSNPNASGEVVTPPPPPPPPTPTLRSLYRETKCTDTVFVRDVTEAIGFDIPARKYRLIVTTYDRNHAPGYQVGQVETVSVHGFGVTQDIADTETEHATEWTTTSAVPSIVLSGVSGSVHGACVTVEELL